VPVLQGGLRRYSALPVYLLSCSGGLDGIRTESSDLPGSDGGPIRISDHGNPINKPIACWGATSGGADCSCCLVHMVAASSVCEGGNIPNRRPNNYLHQGVNNKLCKSSNTETTST